MEHKQTCYKWKTQPHRKGWGRKELSNSGKLFSLFKVHLKEKGQEQKYCIQLVSLFPTARGLEIHATPTIMTVITIASPPPPPPHTPQEWMEKIFWIMRAKVLTQFRNRSDKKKEINCSIRFESEASMWTQGFHKQVGRQAQVDVSPCVVCRPHRYVLVLSTERSLTQWHCFNVKLQVTDSMATNDQILVSNTIFQ